MKTTLATLSAAGLLIASTAAWAEPPSASEQTPGHQMQESGPGDDTTGASGYAPGTQKEPGESASESAPGQVKKSIEDTDAAAGADVDAEADMGAEAETDADTSGGAELEADAEADADVSTGGGAETDSTE